MLKQRTLKTVIHASGVGLHGGVKVNLTLRPAAPDTGIVFRRVDLPEPVDIPISAQAVVDTRMASTIGVGSAKVHTVEHLMSACAGLGLDNLYIDITAEEVPILDGSSASFVFLLQSAGVALQNAPKRFVRVKRPIEVRQGEGAQLGAGEALDNGDELAAVAGGGDGGDDLAGDLQALAHDGAAEQRHRVKQRQRARRARGEVRNEGEK